MNSQFEDNFNNKIQILKYLTKGSFGNVYKCLFNNSKAIIKVEDKTSGTLFCEINFLIRVKNNCPYLPKLLTFGIQNEFRYFVMEKYAKTLFEYPKEAISDTEFKLLYNNILKALYFMHTMKYSHGDINLHNIMLKEPDNFDTIVLIDFGLTYNYSKLEKPSRDINIRNNGNLNYNCVDIMQGYRVTARGDLQNFGFVLEHFFYGLPWFTNSVYKTFNKILTQKKNYVSKDKNINKLINNNLKYLDSFDLILYLI